MKASIMLGLLFYLMISMPQAFEVVAIKPDVSTSGETYVGFHGSDGTDPPWRVIPTDRCVGSRSTAQLLVLYAFDVGFSTRIPLKGSIVGQPEWFNKDLFSLQAKSEK